MLIKKLSVVFFALIVSLVSVSAIAVANDEPKACKADTDCGHGEHCKEGHCHKA